MLVKTKESEFYLGALLITFINGKKKRDQFHTLPYFDFLHLLMLLQINPK